MLRNIFYLKIRAATQRSSHCKTSILGQRKGNGWQEEQRRPNSVHFLLKLGHKRSIRAITPALWDKKENWSIRSSRRALASQILPIFIRNCKKNFYCRKLKKNNFENFILQFRHLKMIHFKRSAGFQEQKICFVSYMYFRHGSLYISGGGGQPGRLSLLDSSVN